MIKWNRKSVWRLLIFFFVVFFNVASAAPAKQVDPQQLERQIRENKSKIQQKKREKLFAERNLGALSRELKFTEMSLVKAKQDLDQSVSREASARQRLSTVRQEYAKSSTEFSQRLRSIYQNQNLGFIEYLFSSRDLTSIVDSAYYFDRILKKDSDLIENLKQKYAEVSLEKSRIEQETQRIRGLKREIGQREDDLTRKAAQQKQYIASLHTQIQEMERQNRELERSSQEIAQAIRRIGNRGGEGYFGSGTFQRPVQAWISSYFGSRMHPIFRRRIHHNGVDFAAPTGARIRAAESGYVIVAGEKREYHGYGKITVIDHGRRKSDGRRISTVYAHQSRIFVNEGDMVKQGEEIGAVGSTGYSTGPHLHFEVREDGAPVDPMRYLR